MNSSKKLLIDLVKAHGRLSVEDFMDLFLTNPTVGYYAKQPVFGERGDFVTAPEISQMFGELLGLWLAQCWIEQERPLKFALLELGPGRGTLMDDLLRATERVAGFHNAMQVYLLEKSPRLREIQKEKLKRYDIIWLDKLQKLPDQPLFFIANEFFDALPIRQFQRVGDIWFERYIVLKDGLLTFEFSPEKIIVPENISSRQDLADGDIVEVCPRGIRICEFLSHCVKSKGGAGLIVDYGNWMSKGDTLQAVKDHKIVGVLETPGLADLTAHVDFAALAEASVCKKSKLTPQGQFLERIGITQRANALCTNLQDDALQLHIAAHKRLTHPTEMGNLFKVMALYPPFVKTPVGF